MTTDPIGFTLGYLLALVIYELVVRPLMMDDDR